MFAALNTMEAAALLEKLIDAAEASGAYYPGDDFDRPGTLGHELHELRMEVREVFCRKYFEVRAAPLYGAVDTRRPVPPYGTKERAEWNASHPDDERSRVPGSGGAS